MKEFLIVLSLLGFCSVRHTWMGIPATAAAGFNLVQIMIIGVIGGMIGVVLFTYLTDPVKRLYKRLFPERAKKFTKMNRRIIRIRQRFGLWGIAFITPPIFSIPVGAIVASSMYSNKKKIFATMFFSVLFWSILSSILSYFIINAAAETISFLLDWLPSNQYAANCS